MRVAARNSLTHELRVYSFTAFTDRQYLHDEKLKPNSPELAHYEARETIGHRALDTESAGVPDLHRHHRVLRTLLCACASPSFSDSMDDETIPRLAPPRRIRRRISSLDITYDEHSIYDIRQSIVETVVDIKAPGAQAVGFGLRPHVYVT